MLQKYLPRRDTLILAAVMGRTLLPTWYSASLFRESSLSFTKAELQPGKCVAAAESLHESIFQILRTIF
jgi:hypothetical protein